MKWKAMLAELLRDGMVICGVLCLTRGAYILHPAAGYMVLGIGALWLAIHVSGPRRGGDGH